MALSRTQSRRLGGIITLVFGETPPEEVMRELYSMEMEESENNRLYLTSRGINEKNRLCTLAGLVIRQSQEERAFRRSDGKGKILLPASSS